MPAYTATGATISPCGRYRYSLWRKWGAAQRPCLFVMLNPAQADAERDDATIRRCVGFATAWGCDRVAVVNLFGFRTSHPKELMAHPDPVGQGNDAAVLAEVWHMAAHASPGPVVAAWGNHGGHMARNRAVLEMLKQEGVPFTCLGKTKPGHPRHPGRIPNATPLEPFGLS